MKTLSSQEFEKKYGTSGVEMFTKTPEAKPTVNENPNRERAVGFAKGAVDTAVGTAKMFHGLGQRFLSAVTPKSLQEVKSKTGLPFLDEQKPEGKMVSEMLSSENEYQTQGKIAEFITELLYPVGKTTEVAGAVKKTGAMFDKLSSRLKTIPDDVIEAGSSLKDNISDLLFKLDDKTKTALSRTPRELFESFVEKGKQALADDAVMTPLESVGDDIVSGLEQLSKRAKSVGQEKTKYLSQAKIGLKRVGNVARDAAVKIRNTFNDLKLDSGDKKVVQQFFNEIKNLGKNPTVKEVDSVIDLLQDSLYKATRSNVIEVTGRVTGPLRKIIGELNGKIQKVAGESYRRFNQNYRDIVEIVTELNARVGKEGGNAGSFVKRLFSPSDARTKYLFEQLQKYTGKDYFRDARLAKFVMEALGDTRAQSLLEQVPTSVRSGIVKLVDKGVNLLRNPVESARRFIDKNPIK